MNCVSAAIAAEDAARSRCVFRDKRLLSVGRGCVSRSGRYRQVEYLRSGPVPSPLLLSRRRRVTLVSSASERSLNKQTVTHSDRYQTFLSDLSPPFLCHTQSTTTGI